MKPKRRHPLLQLEDLGMVLLLLVAVGMCVLPFIDVPARHAVSPASFVRTATPPPPAQVPFPVTPPPAGFVVPLTAAANDAAAPSTCSCDPEV